MVGHAGNEWRVKQPTGRGKQSPIIEAPHANHFMHVNSAGGPRLGHGFITIGITIS